VALRFGLYTLVVAAFLSALPLLARRDGDALPGAFLEGGPLEWTQFGLLVLAGAILVRGALVDERSREAAQMLALLIAFAAVRELDGLLDGLLPWPGWKLGFVLLVPAVWLARRRGDALRAQIARLVTSPAACVLWAGFLVAVPVAQLLGHGAFLRALMGDAYEFAVKQAIQESAECVGYLLLVAGSIEVVLAGRGPPTSDADAPEAADASDASDASVRDGASGRC
jgi:hypothetical protein